MKKKMPNHILDQIVQNKRQEVAHAMEKISLTKLKAFIDTTAPSLDIVAALKNTDKKRARIIAECKRKSPSKGILTPTYDAVRLAKLYESGGASCLSVLSDEKFFGGAIEDVINVKQNVKIPVLRKDFIIDEYQIYETRRAGADSFLLIAGVLDRAQLQYFLEIGRELGMEALVETHSEGDLQLALDTDCKILGINNRDLKTMTVNPQTALDLAKTVLEKSPDRILVYESGVSSRAQIKAGLEGGFSAFLVGESLVTSGDPKAHLEDLLS